MQGSRSRQEGKLKRQCQGRLEGWVRNHAPSGKTGAFGMNEGVSPAEGVASRGLVARLDCDAEMTVRGTAVGLVDWREKEYVVVGTPGTATDDGAWTSTELVAASEVKDIALSSSGTWRFSWRKPRSPMSCAETRRGTMANADSIKGAIDEGGRK
jgi:hypothetical protein